MRNFSQTVPRMSAATSRFLYACRNEQLTHSSDPLIREHLNIPYSPKTSVAVY